MSGSELTAVSSDRSAGGGRGFSLLGLWSSIDRCKMEPGGGRDVIGFIVGPSFEAFFESLVRHG